MQNSDTTNASGMDRYDCRLRQFERNRYFHGKLMTARDMQTEQQYHAGRMHVHSRYVTGTGIVCGLGVTMEAADDDEGSPTAIVEPGVAVDDCGRQIVVEDPDRIDVPATTAGGGRVSVYIEYATCKAESVPVTGSEDACGDECEYNRLRQTYRVTFESTLPEEQKPVPVDRVELPSLEAVREAGGDDQVEPGDDVLHELSRSYHATEDGDSGVRTCDTATDGRLFLGTFTEESDGSWTPTAAEPRPYVYSNDMLHAGLVDHVTDFGNPHDVVASVDGVAPVDGDVDLQSSDGSVVSEALAGEGAVDLRVGEGLQEYVRDKCLKYTIEAFYDVAETYADVETDAASEVVDLATQLILRARDALDDREFADPRTFTAALLDLARLERDLYETLDEQGDELVTDRSLTDYQQALERLLGLLPRASGGQLLDEVPAGFVPPAELAVAQDQLCETAKWLEHSADATMTLPGGTEVERRIIEDAIEPRGRGPQPEPVDPSIGPENVITDGGGTSTFGVDFGDAASVGITVEDSDGLPLVEATLTRGSASGVTFQLETGPVEVAADRLTVAGDATLSVSPQAETAAFDAGSYTVTLSRTDPSGENVDASALVIREATPPSLRALSGTVNGGVASIDVDFGDAATVGIRVAGPQSANNPYVLRANLTRGTDEVVSLGFDTGAVSSEGTPVLSVDGDASVSIVSAPLVDVLSTGSFAVSLLESNVSGSEVDTGTFSVTQPSDGGGFVIDDFVGRTASEVAGDLYSRYDDVTVNYRQPDEVEAEVGTILSATPPQDDDSPPTITVVGTGFEGVGGIGTTNRRNLFENGIFTAEEFSTANRELLGEVLSSNVNLDAVLNNVNDVIRFP